VSDQIRRVFQNEKTSELTHQICGSQICDRIEVVASAGAELAQPSPFDRNSSSQHNSSRKLLDLRRRRGRRFANPECAVPVVRLLLNRHREVPGCVECSRFVESSQLLRF
jgi:hypothetical protein